MLSTKDAVPHVPAWRTQEGKAAPTYLLRHGSVAERSMFEAELAGEYQAGRVFAVDLLDAFQSGVAALLDSPEDQANLIGLAQAEAGGADDLSDEDKRLLREAKAEIGRYWPEYRALRKRLELRRELIPALAFARFCVGWDNVDVPVARGRDGCLSEATLRAIDPLELMSAGNAAFAMLYPSESEGNSEQPSTSDDGQQPTTSDAATGKAG